MPLIFHCMKQTLQLYQEVCHLSTERQYEEEDKTRHVHTQAVLTLSKLQARVKDIVNLRHCLPTSCLSPSYSQLPTTESATTRGRTTEAESAPRAASRTRTASATRKNVCATASAGSLALIPVSISCPSCHFYSGH